MGSHKEGLDQTKSLTTWSDLTADPPKIPFSLYYPTGHLLTSATSAKALEEGGGNHSVLRDHDTPQVKELEKQPHPKTMKAQKAPLGTVPYVPLRTQQTPVLHAVPQ